MPQIQAGYLQSASLCCMASLAMSEDMRAIALLRQRDRDGREISA
jgi:hypothetical protein